MGKMRKFCCLLIFFSTIVVAEEFDFADDAFDIGEQQEIKNWTLGLSHTQAHNDDHTYLQRSSLDYKWQARINQKLYGKLALKYHIYGEQDSYKPKTEESQWQETWLQYGLNDQCSIKLGKQNILWGEVEGTQALDVITPQDYTQVFTTDFASLRNLPWSLAVACFRGKWNWHSFVTPSAEGNISQDNIKAKDLGNEVGIKLSHTGDRKTISLYAASLVANQATIQDGQYPKYNLLGASSSSNHQGWLLKWDIALKDRSEIIYTSDTGKRLDVAIGVEHLTDKQHQWTVSLWQAQYLEQSTQHKAQDLTAIIQWQKDYFSEQLQLNALYMNLTKPKSHSLSLSLDYKYNDYVTFTTAVTASDSEIQPNPLGEDKTFLASLKMVF